MYIHRMATYAGRVHCDLSEQDLVIQGLKPRCNSIIVYRHDTFHPHIHFLMTEVNCSYDTLVNVVKRAIPGAKKDKYSFKKDANDDFISYMSKGKLDPVYNFGFSDELIAQKKLKGYDKDDISRTNSYPVETTPQSKKTTTITQHMLVVEIACRLHAITGEDYPEYEFDLIYSTTADVLREYKKGGDIYYVMKTMESVIMMIYPREHRAMVLQAWNLRHRINF